MEKIEDQKNPKNSNEDFLELLWWEDPQKKLKELKSDPNYMIYKLYELSWDVPSVKKSWWDYAIFSVKDWVFIPQEYKFSIEDIKKNILEEIAYCNDEVRNKYNLFQENWHDIEVLDMLNGSINSQQQYFEELMNTMNTIESVNNNFKKNSLFIMDDNDGGISFWYEYLTMIYEIAYHLNLISSWQEISVSKLIEILSEFYKINYSNQISDEQLENIQRKWSMIGRQISLLEEELKKRS